MLLFAKRKCQNKFYWQLTKRTSLQTDQKARHKSSKKKRKGEAWFLRKLLLLSYLTHLSFSKQSPYTSGMCWNLLYFLCPLLSGEKKKMSARKDNSMLFMYKNHQNIWTKYFPIWTLLYSLVSLVFPLSLGFLCHRELPVKMKINK